MELGAEAVVGERLHAAVGVMDEHHLARAEPPLGYGQRADHVVGDHAAGVAQDVRLAIAQAQGGEDVQARVHARDDGQAAAGPHVQMAVGPGGGEGSVVADEFIDHVHCWRTLDIARGFLPPPAGAHVQSAERFAGPVTTPLSAHGATFYAQHARSPGLLPPEGQGRVEEEASWKPGLVRASGVPENG